MRRPDARYNLTSVEKHDAKREIHALLVGLARERRTATYSEFCDMLTIGLHPHSFIFAHLLREVCRAAEAAGEGVLCALVVSKATGLPGAGYFNRPFPADVLEAAGGTPEGIPDMSAVWAVERDAVFARWADAPSADTPPAGTPPVDTRPVDTLP